MNLKVISDFIARTRIIIVFQFYALHTLYITRADFNLVQNQK